MPRLVLVPGWVISRHDGDSHFITARQLAELYHVPFDKCVVWNPNQGGYRPTIADVILTPRKDGDYTIPQAACDILNKGDPM